MWGGWVVVWEGVGGRVGGRWVGGWEVWGGHFGIAVYNDKDESQRVEATICVYTGYRLRYSNDLQYHRLCDVPFGPSQQRAPQQLALASASSAASLSAPWVASASASRCHWTVHARGQRPRRRNRHARCRHFPSRCLNTPQNELDAPSALITVRHQTDLSNRALKEVVPGRSHASRLANADWVASPDPAGPEGCFPCSCLRCCFFLSTTVSHFPSIATVVIARWQVPVPPRKQAS